MKTNLGERITELLARCDALQATIQQRVPDFFEVVTGVPAKKNDPLTDFIVRTSLKEHAEAADLYLDEDEGWTS